jgi:fatty-acyl-CoA synthase
MPAIQHRPARPSVAKAWQRALELTAPIASQPKRTLPALVEERAAGFGDAPALLSDGQSFTYRDLDRRANQYAAWAIGQGLARGETIGLLLPNSPEYMAAWLGLTRSGATVALLNTQLRGPALAHCIHAAACRRVIVAAQWARELNLALAGAGLVAELWIHGDGFGAAARIDAELDRIAGDRPADLVAPTTDERALLIYTSGTTGLPKAANVSHGRVMQWSLWFAGMMDTTPHDRMYNVLPMYHSVGGVLATGSVLAAGGSVVIRDGFSASRFWSDIKRWECTLFQYIGELCRYLLHSAPVAEEREHRLRMCCGNGLRGDVWPAFAERFRIPRIFEFYAATEGNVSLFNVEGRPGAIGRIPGYLAHRFPVALVRFDAEHELPLRNAAGFCDRCDVDEPGEAIGRIDAASTNIGARFEGYTHNESSESKILRDVFIAGDAWYRTGDLMRRDADGYFYFLDRIGDTFRWKGENVSTAEVAAAILEFPGVTDAMVYGVRVAGNEGRVGMAAICAAAGIDLPALRCHLAAHLPEYARPHILRLTKHLDLTGTFKHAKQRLAGEGYDPRRVDDPLFVEDRERQAYVPLDVSLYRELQSGMLRV